MISYESALISTNICIFVDKINYHYKMSERETLLGKLPGLVACFRRHPIEKVWVFGSFARGEETVDSDVDLLVRYKAGEQVNLLTVGALYSDLHEVLHRDIDLVEDGYLCDFAKESANLDKVLIYDDLNS